MFWNIVLVILIALAIAFFEGRRLLRKGYKKEIWVLSILLVIAAGVNIMQSLHLLN